jgi:hypothetical protein
MTKRETRIFVGRLCQTPARSRRLIETAYKLGLRHWSLVIRHFFHPLFAIS